MVMIVSVVELPINRDDDDDDRAGGHGGDARPEPLRDFCQRISPLHHLLLVDTHALLAIQEGACTPRQCSNIRQGQRFQQERNRPNVRRTCCRQPPNLQVSRRDLSR